jgi:serine/threonine protein phosphatase 1
MPTSSEQGSSANPRVIAVGDVHGCSRALATLLDAIHLEPQDTLVGLGDYLDRGPDSRGVVQLLIGVAQRCRLVPLMGNHEEMALAALDSRMHRAEWFRDGGWLTLESYGGIERVPSEHWEFLHGCRDVFETSTHFFVHANYDPDVVLDSQDRHTLRWVTLNRRYPRIHRNAKTAVVGHTAQRSGEVLDLGYLKCIDTFCYGGGWLTAIDVASHRIWQANDEGILRE